MANTPIMPCGFRFCAAIARVAIASQDMTLREMAKVAICQPMGIYYRAEVLGIPWEQRRKVTRIPAAKLREVWEARDMPQTEAAAVLGISDHTFRKRAKAMGLKPRAFGPSRAEICPEFPSMWRHGVCRKAIAAHCGVTPSTISLTASRMGLPGRAKTHKPITMAEWAQLDLADRMRASAAAEQRQMILAEMADHVSGPRKVGQIMGMAA